MRPDPTFALLLLCFFLSGLAGLVYETAWTRQFSFVFGTSSLAIATVLAAYMAGLAAGAALAARVADRIRRPILVYGLLELGIALAALAIPFGIQASENLYVALYGGQPDLPTSGGLWPAIFYTLCSFAILMVPTAMMGATLPLLARHAVRRDRELAGRVGVLYAVNTAGAVAGTLVAAFVLLPAVGLRQTIWIAAGVNATVFAAAWALARSAGPLAPTPHASPADAGREGRWILPLVAASGVASFAYEVLWVRLLEHLMSGSVHAFATMLASFLTGIALGSALASRWVGTSRRAAAGFAIAQLAIAALSWIAFLGVDAIPALAERLRRDGVGTMTVHALLSMLVLFPPALFIGATFPCAVRVLARDESQAGPASARVYTASTLGSIVGSLGASFVAIPWLGFAGTLSACALLNVALAGVTSFFLGLPRRRVIAATALALLAVAWLRPPPPWKLLTASVRDAGLPELEIEYFGAGRSATVLLVRSVTRWRLTSNGLPEADIDPPVLLHQSTERWMAALPVLARPELESMLLIGLGGGVMLESVPASVRRIDVIELEPEVVAANVAIASRRWRDPLADPRLALHVNDARNALLLSQRRFDAIVSQPSHPWVGGAAHLFTREFFELTRSRLAADGVFVQWMGLGYIDDALIRSLIATLRSVFAHVRVYCPPPCKDAVFVASNAELDVEASSARAIAANRESFAEIGISRPEDATAWLLFDEAAARELAAGATVNDDDRNRIRDESSKVGKGRLRGRTDALYAPVDPLMRGAALAGSPLFVLEAADRRRAARLAGLGSSAFRMRGLDRVERAAARAIAEVPGAGGDGTRDALVAALAGAPQHRAGRAALLRLSAREIADGLDPEALVAGPLDAAERAVARGWQAEADADADAASWDALDAELEAVAPEHPLFRDAQRLRVRWRVASGDPARARGALPILDRVLRQDPDDYLLRARACIVAGEHEAAIDSLLTVSLQLSRPHVHYPGRVLEARALVDEVAWKPELHGLRNALEQQLNAAASIRSRDRARRSR